MKGKILLVEDAPLAVAAVKKELDFLGYDCLVAQDCAEAVEKASEFLPDLIVMDISLPGMRGLEAVSQIRKNPQTQAIPILAATARTMPRHREICLQAGCDAYIAKPFSHRELSACIRKLLKGDR